MTEKIAQMYDGNYIFPIIYNIKDINRVIGSSSNTVLLGRVLNILNIKRVVRYIKESGKLVIVDIDLIGGMSNEKYAVGFIAKEVGADGIISTHGETILNAKRENLISILKIFTYDEHSIDSAVKVINFCKPNIIEALPGVAVPYFIGNLRKHTDAPVNASGFLGDKLSEVAKLIKLGASAIHTGNPKLWDADFVKFFNEYGDNY